MINPFKAIQDRMMGEGGPITTADQQTADEKKLAAFVKKRIEDTRSASNRIAHEGTWMTNIAYLLGFDSVYYDTNMKKFVSLDNAARVGLKRNRVFENVILPAVQNRQARLCKSPPKFEVNPEDNSNEAKEGARLGFDVLLQLWDDCNINVKRLALTMWLQQCGHGYLKVIFDDEKGEPLIDPQTNEVMGYEGKIDVEVASAFEIFPDPLATTADELQWLVQAKVRKLDYFKTRYPERGPLVKEEGAWLLSVQYEQRIQSLNNAGISSAGTQLQMENSAIELSYYEKRSRKHPEGRHVVVANGIVLKDGPLAVGVIPFAKFDDVLVAGKYYSEATITHARPIQDQYNRILTRRAQWANRLLAGKYIAARGHGLHPEALNDESGEVIEFDPVPGAQEPHAVQVPVMPQYAYTETDKLKSSLYEIFGLSEVSRGQLPSAGIPAVGMQLLLEQDETRIGVEVEQHEHAYAYIGELLLRFAAKNYKTPRKLVQKGINNEISVKEYSGDDLPARPDVRVTRGSTVPTSRSMRRQEILNVYQLGLLGNPQDPLTQERVLDMLEFGDTGGIWKKSALKNNQVKRMINQIEMGILPESNKKDDHALIIQELNDYRISDKGTEADPMQKQLLEQVIQTHLDFATQLANPQLAQMEQNVNDGLAPDGQQLDTSGLAPNGGMPQNEMQPQEPM